MLSTQNPHRAKGYGIAKLWRRWRKILAAWFYSGVVCIVLALVLGILDHWTTDMARRFVAAVPGASRLTPKEFLDGLNSARGTSLQFLTFVISIAAIAFTAHTAIDTWRSQGADRLAKATELLSSEGSNETKRMSAVCLLARLARESVTDERDVVDILTSHLRETHKVDQGHPPHVCRALNLIVQYAPSVLADAGSLDLSGISFSGTSFRKARLDSANLSCCNFTDADLSRTDLRRAVLSKSTFIGTTLEYARLEDATLSDAVLENVSLHGASLRNTDLTGADLRLTQIKNTDLKDAVLINTDFRGVDLTGARGLTIKQLSHAQTNAATVLPAYLAQLSSVSREDDLTESQVNPTVAQSAVQQIASVPPSSRTQLIKR